MDRFSFDTSQKKVIFEKKKSRRNSSDRHAHTGILVYAGTPPSGI